MVEVQGLEKLIEQIKKEPNKKPLMDLVEQYHSMLKHEIVELKSELEHLQDAQSHEADAEKKEALKSKIGDLQKDVQVRELNLGNDPLLKLAEEIRVAEGAALAMMKAAWPRVCSTTALRKSVLNSMLMWS